MSVVLQPADKVDFAAEPRELAVAGVAAEKAILEGNGNLLLKVSRTELLGKFPAPGSYSAELKGKIGDVPVKGLITFSVK